MRPLWQIVVLIPLWLIYKAASAYVKWMDQTF